MKIKMKIRTRLFLTFLISAVAISVVSIGAVAFFSSSALKGAIVEQIKATAASRANHVNNFIIERESEIIALADNHHIVDYSMEYWRQQNDDVENLWEPLTEGVNLFDHTQAALRAIRRDASNEVFILNDQGVVVMSSSDDFIGLDRSGEKYFNDIKSLETRGEVYIENVHKDGDEVSMNIAIPFYRPDNNNFFGVLVKKFNTEELNAIVADNSGLGETGETYIINNDGYIITESRFKDDVVLKERINTSNGTHTCFSGDEVMAETSDEHERSILGTFSSYRGIEVIGTHRHVPSVNWCLLVELGSKEAFVSSNRLWIISLIVIAVTIVIALVVARLVGGVIGRPVEELQRDIKKIEDGDLDHKIAVRRNDELGELGDAYNDMVEAMRQSKKEVEIRVEEQTKNITKQKEQLVSQNKELKRLKELSDENIKTSEENRTKLQKALDEARENKEELERMNDLMVGREMKMIELKKKIKGEEIYESGEDVDNKDV
ncbi:cache domain-containing protein [Patescibacteria group bacterium]